MCLDRRRERHVASRQQRRMGYVMHDGIVRLLRSFQVALPDRQPLDIDAPLHEDIVGRVSERTDNLRTTVMSALLSGIWMPRARLPKSEAATGASSV